MSPSLVLALGAARVRLCAPEVVLAAARARLGAFEVPERAGQRPTLARENKRENSGENTRDLTRENTRDLTRENTRDLTRENTRDLTRENTRDLTQENTRDLTLEVTPSVRFEPALERETSARVVPDGDERVRLEGGVRGGFDLARGHGWLVEARGLGAVDALLRAALSLSLPARGQLLLHGALVPDAAAPDAAASNAAASDAAASNASAGPRARVFTGASGAGKSTVAAALGAACDELTIVGPGPCGGLALATPWWRGRPFEAHLVQLVCLRRSGAGSPAPSIAPRSGTEALRALLPNLVRYVSLPAVERQLLAVAARLCAAVPLVEATCPEGAAFLPFLRAGLGLEEAA